MGCVLSTTVRPCLAESDHTFTIPSELPVISAEWSVLYAMSQMMPSCSPMHATSSSHHTDHAHPPPVQKCSFLPAAIATVSFDSGMQLYGEEGQNPLTRTQPSTWTERESSTEGRGRSE